MRGSVAVCPGLAYRREPEHCVQLLVPRLIRNSEAERNLRDKRQQGREKPESAEAGFSRTRDTRHSRILPADPSQAIRLAHTAASAPT